MIEVTYLGGGNINPNNTRIRPFAKGITPQFNGNKMTFTVPRAEKLIVEINTPFQQKFNSYSPGILYLFGEDPITNAPPSSGANIKNAGQLGIDQAFSQAVAGDTIYIPRAKYTLTSSLRVTKNNITVYFEPGAFITVPNRNFAPISADGVSNLTIRGRGTIESGAPGMALTRVTNLLLEDVTLRNADCPSDTGFFTLIFGSHTARLNNLKTIMFPPLATSQKCGRAAYVFNSNENLVVENSFIESHEDGTALKSFVWGGISAARQDVFANNNITLRNNIMYGGNDIGTELDSNVNHIRWENNTIISGSFSIKSDDYHVLSDIKYSNNTIESPGTEQFFKVGSDFNNTITPNEGDLDLIIENLSVGKVWRPTVPDNDKDPGIIIAGKNGTTQNVQFINLRVEGSCISSLQDLKNKGYNPVITGSDTTVTFTGCNGSTPIPTPTPTLPPLLGDANNDGLVNLLDYNKIVEFFTQSNCTYNLNNSCVIDIFDYNEFYEHYNP